MAATRRRLDEFAGPLFGLAALAVIGLGFFWVIRAEYALGWTWWPYFMAVGALAVGASLFVHVAAVSAVLGIAGASVIWGSTELRAQATRVERGWYPANPRGKLKAPLESVIKKLKAPSL